MAPWTWFPGISAVCLAAFISMSRISMQNSANLAENQILDSLLKEGYDKRILPPSDGPVVVNVSLLLLSLSSPDESSLKYEIEFLFHQRWVDPRLRHRNHSRKNYLNAYQHLDHLWLPDTLFILHGDFKDPTVPNLVLRVFSSGDVQYTTRRSLVLSCQGDLRIFPFDFPLCSFSLESNSYEQDMLKYQWVSDTEGGNGILRGEKLTMLNAYLMDNSTVRCDVSSWRGEFSCLRVDLKFTRDRAFYFTTVFIPGLVLVSSSFTTFWLEWNAVPARVMIGVTTILNFFTTSNGFRSNLPVVSNLTAMNAWDGVCMVFIYASMLSFICVNYIGRKRSMPKLLLLGMKRMRLRSIRKHRSDKKNGNLPVVVEAGSSSRVVYEAGRQDASSEDGYNPVRIAKSIDVISRVVFPVAYLCFLMYFFLWYIHQ